MRVSSSPRSRAGTPRLASLLQLASWAAPIASAFSFSPIPSPNLNLDQLGNVAFAGDFDAISLYQFQGQNEYVSPMDGRWSLHSISDAPSEQRQSAAQLDDFRDCHLPAEFLSFLLLTSLRQSTGLDGLILSRYPNGLFATVNKTDGEVKAMCPFVSKGELQGIGKTSLDLDGLSTVYACTTDLADLMQ